MNKSILNFFLLLLVTILIGGCKKDKNSCAYYEEAPPRYMFAPDSAKTNSTISIRVVYDNQKPCQLFDSFNSNTVDSTTTFTIQTKIDTCDCQDQYGAQEQFFQYQAPSTPGHSIIKIHVVDTLYYRDTIVVH